MHPFKQHVCTQKKVVKSIQKISCVWFVLVTARFYFDGFGWKKGYLKFTRVCWAGKEINVDKSGNKPFSDNLCSARFSTKQKLILLFTFAQHKISILDALSSNKIFLVCSTLLSWLFSSSVISLQKWNKKM